MFPPKPGTKPRVRGVRKPQMAFRPPAHLQAYIEAAEKAGYSRTDVIVRMLDLAKDVTETLGQGWWEIERQAHLDKISPGVALAELVKDCLAAKPAKPKK